MLYPWHQPQFEQLSIRAANQRLHHGLLLHGSAGTGKHHFAEYLATYLLCQNKGKTHCGECQSCQLVKASSHPDWHVITTDKQIGVDAVRQAIGKLSATSQLGGAKTLIIYHAERITESAANALLKTLEEPTERTYIILVSHLISRLLPTVLSRCEKIKLPSPDADTCKRWLESQGFSSVDDTLIRYYQCAPLSIAEALQDDNELRFDEFITSLTALRSDQKDALALAAQWQEHAERVTGWLQHWLTDQNLQHYSNDMWALYQHSIDAKRQLLNPGINKLALLSELFMQVAQSGKQEKR
ncbi:DNA polymerase III subunit delta' [Aestuariibacter salexigens]|uniref:DNA polymerase III subunit delta' n=1 Tax=Aestuariibacter salexigens TaxID=226010 RepID=UPI00041AEDA5|nr:DNA polymerase III subunit delta' [Aestuariibacter salexigens]